MHRHPVADRGPSFCQTQQGEKSTSTRTDLRTLRIATPVLRLNYLFTAPWITFSNPLEILPGQNLALTITVALIGTLGVTLGRKSLVTLASSILLTLLILGKIASDILKTPAPDTAVLLVQFIAIIFLMEASKVIITFDRTYRGLSARQDEVSRLIRERIISWTRGQLLRQTRLALATLGLSLGLIVVGGFTSISVNQLYFSATLIIVSVAVLLFLLTHRREPGPERVSDGSSE